MWVKRKAQKCTQIIPHYLGDRVWGSGPTFAIDQFCDSFSIENMGMMDSKEQGSPSKSKVQMGLVIYYS